MNKNERILIIGITARLKTVVDSLNKAISPVDNKECVCIICEQIVALHGIISDIVKGGASNG